MKRCLAPCKSQSRKLLPHRALDWVEFVCYFGFTANIWLLMMWHWIKGLFVHLLMPASFVPVCTSSSLLDQRWVWKGWILGNKMNTPARFDMIWPVAMGNTQFFYTILFVHRTFQVWMNLSIVFDMVYSIYDGPDHWPPKIKFKIKVEGT